MVKIYVNWISPPSRAILMICKMAAIEVDTQFIDLATGQQNSPEFLKINPDHCVPTLVDGQFTLWESRPMGIYLIDKYAPDHQLFPKDLQKRALIHKMLDFDLSVVYKAIGTYVFPLLLRGVSASPDEMEAMFKRLDETVFNKRQYAVGECVTLADIFLMATCTFPEVVGYSISTKKFPNLTAWMKRIKGTDFYKDVDSNYEALKKKMLKK